MSGFIARCTGKMDYSDGDGIDLSLFRAALTLYDKGTIDAAYIAAAFNLNAEQSTELDQILDTRPLLSTQYPLWESHVIAVMVAGYANEQLGWPGFTTVALCRTKLGL